MICVLTDKWKYVSVSQQLTLQNVMTEANLIFLNKTFLNLEVIEHTQCIKLSLDTEYGNQSHIKKNTLT